MIYKGYLQSTSKSSLIELFSGNIIKHPCFDQMRETGEGYRIVGELTNTDLIMNNSFWVGVYPGMTDEKIDYMAKVIKEGLEQ